MVGFPLSTSFHFHDVLSKMTTARSKRVSTVLFINHSPKALIPAENRNNNELITKNVIDSPICNQDPVSRTRLKNINVITETGDEESDVERELNHSRRCERTIAYAY